MYTIHQYKIISTTKVHMYDWIFSSYTISSEIIFKFDRWITKYEYKLTLSYFNIYQCSKVHIYDRMLPRVSYITIEYFPPKFLRNYFQISYFPTEYFPPKLLKVWNQIDRSGVWFSSTFKPLWIGKHLNTIQWFTFTYYN